MKKLEDYVCTLEQAKRLHKLGIKQDSLFMYFDKNGFYTEYLDVMGEKDHYYLLETDGWEHILWSHECYSAFTSQELGELIKQHNKNIIHQTINYKEEYVFSGGCQLYSWNKTITKSIEAQARAEFLINLLENKK